MVNERRLPGWFSNEDDLEGARPAHAFYSLQFDVTGRRRAADPGERTASGTGCTT